MNHCVLLLVVLCFSTSAIAETTRLYHLDTGKVTSTVVQKNMKPFTANHVFDGVTGTATTPSSLPHHTHQIGVSFDFDHSAGTLHVTATDGNQPSTVARQIVPDTYSLTLRQPDLVRIRSLVYISELLRHRHYISTAALLSPPPAAAPAEKYSRYHAMFYGRTSDDPVFVGSTPEWFRFMIDNTDLVPMPVHPPWLIRDQISQFEQKLPADHAILTELASYCTRAHPAYRRVIGLNDALRSNRHLHDWPGLREILSELGIEEKALDREPYSQLAQLSNDGFSIYKAIIAASSETNSRTDKTSMQNSHVVDEWPIMLEIPSSSLPDIGPLIGLRPWNADEAFSGVNIVRLETMADTPITVSSDTSSTTVLSLVMPGKINANHMRLNIPIGRTRNVLSPYSVEMAPALVAGTPVRWTSLRYPSPQSQEFIRELSVFLFDR